MTSVPTVTVLIAYEARPGMAEQAQTELAALVEIVVAREPACRGIRMLRDPYSNKPHVMFYAPGLTDADIGTAPVDRGGCGRRLRRAQCD